jgi:hypothetical protein
MTTSEREAIQRAIVAGIETALRRVLEQPFPSGDVSSSIFHARSNIEDAVHSELDAIEVSDAEREPARDPYGNEV